MKEFLGKIRTPQNHTFWSFYGGLFKIFGLPAGKPPGVITSD